MATTPKLIKLTTLLLALVLVFLSSAPAAFVGASSVLARGPIPSLSHRAAYAGVLHHHGGGLVTRHKNKRTAAAAPASGKKKAKRLCRPRPPPTPTPIPNEPAPEPVGSQPTPDPTKEEPEPTLTEDPIEEPTEEPSPTEEPTEEQTPTPEPEPEPQPEPEPEPEPTPTPTEEPGEEPTEEPTPTPEPEPEPEPEQCPRPDFVPNPGKAGLIWTHGNHPALQCFVTNETRYIYDFSDKVPAWNPFAESLGLDFFPFGTAGTAASNLDPMYAGNVVGFYQPPSSATLAAERWINKVEPSCRGCSECILPMVDARRSETTIPWMNQFLEACNGECTFNGVAVAWQGTDANTFKADMELWYNTFNVPLYVAVFECYSNGMECPRPALDVFNAEVIQWLDEQDYVKAYFSRTERWRINGIMSKTRGVWTEAGCATYV